MWSSMIRSEAPKSLQLSSCIHQDNPGRRDCTMSSTPHSRHLLRARGRCNHTLPILSSPWTSPLWGHVLDSTSHAQHERPASTVRCAATRPRLFSSTSTPNHQPNPGST
ncbi:hypothetical protein CPLU01_02162 [Colletotrichum plurivorum]|uniref:Uncharacterized protein n=1 Tax=Colletotrichum plurivorum TaxID=2175906 RepID=A0A8H6NMA9_9PEZI|nr:hypothetical protein CPLU01_02162 [Colletotrichum plurivorum]